MISYIGIELGPDLIEFLCHRRSKEPTLFVIRVIERLNDDHYEKLHKYYLNYVDERIEIECSENRTATTHRLIYKSY